MGPRQGAPGDRRVVLLVGALVLAVMAASLLSALLPGIDGLLGSLPVVVVLLVAGTLLVLARALRR